MGAMLTEYGPERLQGQGLDPHQYESGDRTILALLAEAPACDQIDLVATWRDREEELASCKMGSFCKFTLFRRGNRRFGKVLASPAALPR